MRARLQRLGGMPAFSEAGISLLTVFLALIVGGLAMAFTGANPLGVYKDLIVGAGFDWPFHLIPGNPLGVEPLLAENNLVSTLVQFTPLVLTGLAVAFAFRCGLFNIGGTGQFWVGSMCALLVAQHVGGVSGMLIATIAAGAGGAVWAGLAGGLKAYRGAHEVITTIMLNWIAIYTTQYLVGIGGPFTDNSVGNGVSKSIKASAQYPGMWGVVQQIHIGIFLALACAVIYYVILNRTTLGYEVRAVGLNPEAARYGGISVTRSVVASMAICGVFAGLAGAVQVLGVNYSIPASDVPVIDVGFTGIAVALLGRNTAVGVVLAAFLFAALQSGGRQLSGTFSPELAGGVSSIIQGTIILLVGGELVVRWLMARAKRERVIPPDVSATAPPPQLPPPAGAAGL
ncbi:MAG: ral nucleoside transport system permease protein [Gaiellales bacterium]|nr:ral nucleoside transport system permease protein [Gaiellales bacterium]